MLPTNELAAILTLSDYFFARDGIANEDILNREQMIIADLDLELLEEQRLNCSVIPLHDVIQDAYDRVIHCVDRHVNRAPVAGGMSRSSRAASGDDLGCGCVPDGARILSWPSDNKVES